MIIQLFYGELLKEFFFKNVFDGRYKIFLYSYECGLDEDIEFYIDINNGIKRVNGKINSVTRKNGDICNDNIVDENDFVLLSLKNVPEKIGLLFFKSNTGIISFDKYVVDKNYIEVGKNGVIYYDNNTDTSRFFSIEYEENMTYIIPYINRIYHNGKLINDKTRIRFGDLVTYNKLKVVYLGNIIATNNPDGKIRCNLKKFHYADIKNVNSIGNLHEFEDESYFTRSPRITHRVIEETIEIDSPPTKKENREKPLLYTIGPSLTMSAAMIVSVIFMIRANGNGSSMLPSALMAISMFMGAVLWPILSRRYTKNQIIKDENIRKDKYSAYIDKIDKELNEKAEYNRKVYNELYPSIENLLSDVIDNNELLWNHTSKDDSFLDIRIGKGIRAFTINVNIQKERFTIEDDSLRIYAGLLKQKYAYLSDVPISISFNNVRTVGIVGNMDKRLDLTRTIIARLAITHCYTEVKMALFFEKRDSEFWQFTKCLPHFWNKGKNERFLADDKEGSHIIINRLKQIYNQRLENGEKTKFLPHYIVFVTDRSLVANDSEIEIMVDKSWRYGITFVFIGDSVSNLPDDCGNIIQLSKNECTIHNKDDNSGKMMTFTPDESKNESKNIKKISESLSTIKVKEIDEEIMIPERLSFLELYRAKNIEELSISNRWKEAQPFKTLEAPIGVGVNEEIFSLNIHEKYHGPHGLIAGTTRSGKSEFIQSFILSLAINYHPYDVGFMLIDYKGGGMANAFVDLPHVLGTITNLDGNQIKRSLTSLKSELERRQDIFAKYGVNHIDLYQMKYKKGEAKEPLPHLVIISDEFAELKEQEPEFMVELVSTTRIGGSLGVHLILATQKPTGVVNDQIWSNTKFRVCLRVADKQDSKEMIKREDAASIVLQGRCCVQVGNDEIFKVIQSGYSGEKYADNCFENDTVNVICIDLQGNELYRVSHKNTNESNDKTQLSAIVDYIKKYFKSQNIAQLKLWLPSLPKTLFLNDIEKRNEGFDGDKWYSCKEWLNVAIGMFDEPKKQNQGKVYIDFGKNGHLLLYGAPGTGKTTFFQTLIYALANRYTPNDINMYILDFGSRSLSYCKLLPHVGDVVFSDDTSKISKLFQRIDKEIANRKKAFAEYGVGNIKVYMDASKKRIPAIILFIDNYSAFIELYQDYENVLIRLSREGENYGIYIVINSSSVNAIKRKITENVKTVCTLQLNDLYDYMNVIGRTDGVLPENVKGRGLINNGSVLEFQTALAISEENDAQRVKMLKDEFNKMSNVWKGDVPESIPVIPEDMDIESVILNDEYIDAVNAERIPIGYDIENVELISLKFDDTYIFKIIGDNCTGKSTILANIIRTNKNRTVWLIDNKEQSIKKLIKEREVLHYASNNIELENLMKAFNDEMLKRNNEFTDYSGDLPKSEFVKKYDEIIFIVDDFDYFCELLSEWNLEFFKQILNRSEGLRINIFVCLNSRIIYKYKSQPVFEKILNCQTGIALGNIDNLAFYDINVPYTVKNKYEAEQGKGFYINYGDYRPLKAPFVKS